MEGGRITDQKKKNTSSGFNLVDEKIKLIDIQLEDDDFLVASPFSEDFFPDVGIIEQDENHLRRSLAWDSAFFNSAGVLDPDELSFMNKGFRKTETNLLPGTNDVFNPTEYAHDFYAEVEPSICNPMSNKALKVFDKSPESGLRQKGMQASKKVVESCRSKPTSRRNGTTPSPLPQKAIGEATNISTKLNKENLSGKSYLQMDKRSTTSCSNPGKIRYPASFPTSKIWRHPGRNKGMGNDINASTRSLSLSSIESKDAKEASALKASLQSSLSSANSSKASPGTRLLTQTLRPSGLRPPTYHTKLSHENSALSYHGETRTRKLPQAKGTAFGCSNNGHSSSGKKLKTPCSDVPKNIKRPKIESLSNSQVMKQGKCLETGRVAVDQESVMKKPSYSFDRLENLSRYFEAIDLNQEKRVNRPSKHNKIDALKQENQRRIPLSDKTFSCNFSGTYQWNLRRRS